MVEVSKDGLRDVYEVANQLAGYVGPDTPNELAQFLVRESKEAARLGDRVSTLQAERDRYRVALEPFAAAASNLNMDDDECVQDRVAAYKITFGHLRAARTALSDAPVQS